MRIDLGCGHEKTDGFVGIDRYPLPGVDLVADLSQGIPLIDGCVDYVIASHSLEHFANLPALMSDLTRVCRDRAIITIAGPYSGSRLNEANPYHLSTFNEHTPRFWTNDIDWLPDCDGRDFPGIAAWGIAGSDNSSWAGNIRLVKAEYFYFPAYRSLPDNVKATLRQKMTDICDGFVFHCVVLKSPISKDELTNIRETTFFFESYGVPIRREHEASPGPPDLITHLASLSAKIQQLEFVIESLQNRILKLEEDHLFAAATSLKD